MLKGCPSSTPSMKGLVLTESCVGQFKVGETSFHMRCSRYRVFLLCTFGSCISVLLGSCAKSYGAYCPVLPSRVDNDFLCESVRVVVRKTLTWRMLGLYSKPDAQFQVCDISLHSYNHSLSQCYLLTDWGSQAQKD